MESASELPSSRVAFDEVYKAGASSPLPPRPPPRPSTAVKPPPGRSPRREKLHLPYPGIAERSNYGRGKPSRPPRAQEPLPTAPTPWRPGGPGASRRGPCTPRAPRAPQRPQSGPTLAGRRRAQGGGRARPAPLKVKPSARGAEPSAALDRPRQLRPGAGDARGRAGPATRPAPSPRRPRAPGTRPPRGDPGASRAPGPARRREGAGPPRPGAGPRLPPAPEWSALQETHTLHYCLVGTKFCHTAGKVWRLAMTRTRVIRP